MAASNTVGAVANTAKGIVNVTAHGVNRVGRSVTGRFNNAVRKVIKGRKSRRNRRNRSRRNRRN